MKQYSLESYLSLVAEFIKDESRKGKCSVRIAINDNHNDILTKELESVGYKTKKSVDGESLWIMWAKD